MSDYPIIFGLRDHIEGDGFLAFVKVAGRALLHEEEDGDAWVEGVNPGGFVATGNSLVEALEEFRRSYTGAQTAPPLPRTPPRRGGARSRPR